MQHGESILIIKKNDYCSFAFEDYCSIHAQKRIEKFVVFFNKKNCTQVIWAPKKIKK